MEIGEDTPKPIKPEISVKVEPIPMEVEPSEKPSGEEPVVEPSASDEPMKEEVKTEPLEDNIEEESMEVTPKPEPPELSGKTSYSYLFFLVKSHWGSSRFRLFTNFHKFFVCKCSNLINFLVKSQWVVIFSQQEFSFLK